MIRRVIGSTAVLLLLPRLAAACPVCFGAADGPMLRGSNMGIFALLVVTLGMLGAFAAFFTALARRARRVAEDTAAGGSRHAPVAQAPGGSAR